MNALTENDFLPRLEGTARDIESLLDRLLAPACLPGEIARPGRLMEAMRYAMLGGGKRLRPHLVVETARLFGAEGTGPLRAGAAVECIHGYSLVHDDLPAMDDVALRRGKPTVHKAYDDATAILAGDALLTLAFDILADQATDPDPAIRVDLTNHLWQYQYPDRYFVRASDSSAVGRVSAAMLFFMISSAQAVRSSCSPATASLGTQSA